MTTLNLSKNPFKHLTPEAMDAADVFALFVDPFTDSNKVSEPGHTMVNGPRGCGKSMIFRYLLPDCQSLALSVPLKKLPFLAFLISIKNTIPNITELRRLDSVDSEVVLNEHALTTYVAAQVFDELRKLPLESTAENCKAARDFLCDYFADLMSGAGMTLKIPETPFDSAGDVFTYISQVCNDLYSRTIQYARRLVFRPTTDASYDGPLCGYLDFLFPLLKRLASLPFLPSSTIYLLIDDADYLNLAQTKVLNSWISTRTQSVVSIKVSTQLRYKTYSTTSGLPIQSPHDFQAINIADIHTNRRSNYLKRVREIVAKRLDRSGLKVTPEEFFLPDKEQEKKIQEIAKQIRADFSETGRGHRADDDATRYARPNFIRSLAGQSKSGSSYSYSGFEQLVHISSGVVRYFLEPAAQMFDEQASRRPKDKVRFIDPGVQNEVVRREADALMLGEFERIMKEEVDQDGSEVSALQERMRQLQNLIMSLGGTFYFKLISDDAERRVFSVAISGTPDPIVIETFELGVRFGYFHRSTIGNKEGTGRTRLYVLTRRLAPFFKLDPSSFAGYLWLSNDLLIEGMANSERILRKIERDGVSRHSETSQLSLFD